MIRINLLPQEHRRNERTSPRVFASTILGVIMVCSAFGWFGFVYLGELGNMEVEEAAVAEDLANKNKQATYHDALETEKKEFEKRTNTIQAIAKSRVIWTEVLDQLIDVVNNDGDSERHLAWFTALNVSAGDGKSKGPAVTMPGFVQGNLIKRVADFTDDFENAPFYPNVALKGAPSAVVDVNPKKIPPESMSFALNWTFKQAKDWVRKDPEEGKK